MNQIQNAYRVLVARPYKKRLLRRLEVRINVDQKKQCNDMDWIQLAQSKVKRRAFVNTVIKLQAP
jgi:hypothetical protein